jgi:hypothetical protein
MRDHAGMARAFSDEVDWLPPGVIEVSPSGPRRGTPPDRQCLTLVADALRDAPSGRVAVMADHPGSPFLALKVAGREVDVVDGMAFIDAAAVTPRDALPDLAGCVLDGLLERVDRPLALLQAARERLVPGGVLVATAGSSGRKIAGRPVVRRDDRLRLFPGQTLPSLLFRAGFEMPAFRGGRQSRIVIARRATLAPIDQRPAGLSVIMPVYNERETFEKAIELVLAKEIPDTDIEVIVVESNSTDGTRELAIGFDGVPNVSVILEDRPLGKGHAVRRGLESAGGDFVLIQDADLEYDVDDYATLLEPLRRCETGFVLGTRARPDGAWGMRHFARNTTMSHVMNAGHIVFLALFNMVYQQRLHDPFTMYKVFRRDCLHGIELECNRFDFDWELTAKLIRAGYQPIEIPVSYQSRSFAEGKKITLVRDPLTWVKACFRYRFSRLYSYE